MDVPTLIDDLAYLWTVLFGWPLVMLGAALITGSFLFSISVVTVYMIRNQE